ncbi:MAG: LamG domain-containing protein, partial [Candidatus Marsarchaeota archaeon]|nr:LamG domain-containing protein [Candidatus Marsarchaeota archaeon]
APKAPPGACQVYRPEGPGTTTNINIEGICSGELPQYVADFKSVYNSGGGYIDLGTNPNTGPVKNSWTLVYWISFSSLPPTSSNYGFPFNNNRNPNWIDTKVFYPSTLGYEIYNVSNSAYHGCTGFAVSTNTWYQQALVINETSLQVMEYGDGAVYSPCTATLAGAYSYYSNGPFYISNPYINGSIANVQIYNTSLTANEIQYLYTEGIGGAPVNLQQIVGWWPLNGNVNDYSGNSNNGKVAGIVTYAGQWDTGYAAP